MTIIGDLLTQIQSTLGSGTSPSLSAASDTSDIFEAYIFSLVIEAAHIEGASIMFQDVTGQNNPPVFIFRTSPGYIFSAIQPYTHAVIAFNNKPILEAHLGVRVAGISHVLHECDVAVIEQAEAATCRLRQVAPRSSKIILAVECKFYTTNLQLHLAREFIGLSSDLYGSSEQIFVSNTSSDTVERLLTSRRKIWDHNIQPASNSEVNRLRGKFQNAFQKYKAK
jgi:hypothetical protein